MKTYKRSSCRDYLLCFVYVIVTINIISSLYISSLTKTSGYEKAVQSPVPAAMHNPCGYYIVTGTTPISH